MSPVLLLFLFLARPQGAPPPPADRRVETLVAAERFEEASRLLDGEKTLDLAARAKLREKIEGGRRATLARYEQSLDLALRSIAGSSPIDPPEYVPNLLHGSVPPRTVIAPAPARFAWVEEFLSLYDQHLPKIRSLEKVAAADLLAAARAFENCARNAREARLFPEFQTALAVGHALRRTRVLALADGGDDAELDRVAADSEQALQACDRALGAHPSGVKEIEDFRTAVLVPYGSMLRQARERARVRSNFRANLELWVSRADRSLADASTMADPAALRAVAVELGSFEADARWKEFPGAPRARAIFARGILEVTAELLEGAPPEQAFERIAPKVKAARALDAGAEDAWKGRLSPKLLAGLERLSH